MSTIRESLAELNLNLDKAGFAVHETLARKRSKDRDYKPRYLAICIGKLIRGDVTWWKNHRDSLAALADVLDVSPDLLLSSASGGGAAARLVLDSFPQLPPLRHDESPCAVTSNGRPLVDALAIGAPGRHVWIVAGAGAGKTLAADLWSRRAGVAACVLHVRTLMEATSRIEDAAAVVIDVDRADGERDPFALVQLTSRVRYVRVLAAFPPPPTEGTGLAVEGFDVLRWHPDPGWRDVFVRWVAGRLPEADRYDPAAVVAHLADLDPRCELFDTPGALLPLLALEVGRRLLRSDAPLARAEVFWPEQACMGGDAWLRENGGCILRALVAARWRDPVLPLGALPASTWATLVPDELMPRPSTATIEKALERVAYAGSKTKRSHALEEARAAVTPSGPAEIIEALATAGLLRSQANGGLDVHPPWLRQEIHRKIAREALVDGPASRWGVLGVDPGRRRLLDEALDGLERSEFVETARRVVDEHDDSLASVVATEALFSAAGRRLRDWTPDARAHDVLRRLGQKQVEQLTLADSFPGAPRVPLTRAAGTNSTGGPAWHGEAWGFSLCVSRDGDLPAEHWWTFPGWAPPGALRLAAMPGQCGIRYALRHDSAEYALLTAAAPRVVELVADAEVPTDLGTTLLPAVVVAAPQRGWRLQGRHLDALADEAVASALAELMAKAEPATRDAVVSTLWELGMQKGDGDPFRALRALRGQLLTRVLLDALPPHVFAAACAKVDWRQAAVADLDALPERLRDVALGALADGVAPGSTPDRFEPFVARLGMRELDVLVRFVAERSSVGQKAAERVWALDPRRALQEVRHALGAHDDVGFVWLSSAPNATLEPILLDLEGRNDPPWWVYRWGARMLPKSGRLAERVFRVMRAVRRQEG